MWKGSAWLIEPTVCHFTDISKYNPFSGGLPLWYLNKELDHSRKPFNKIQNADQNKCFRWCLIIYLNPAGRNPERMRRVDKKFVKQFDFKVIELH